MQIDAILTFRSYIPKKIKKGMLFLISSDEYTPIVYHLDKTPPTKKEKEEFLSILGNPVLPYIINPSHKGKGSHVLLSPDKIHWISENEETKEINVEHFNEILSKFEGKIKLEVTEDGKTPFFLNGKAIIYYPEESVVEI